MISLATNVSDLILQRTLYESTLGLNSAIESMTTGFKVNHAKDNAAGYSIIEDLNTRISSMLQVQANTQDGISLLGTAEGGLNEIRNLLQRVRELTIQASNGNYDSKSRDAMQAEADALIEQINQIKNSIQYDGMSLYSKPANDAVNRIAQGANISVDFTPAENETLQVTNSQSGADSSLAPDAFSFNQPTKSYSMTRTMSANNGVATASLEDTISGNLTLAKNETQEINIDGVIYTVTNNKTGNQSISYEKDTTTGAITINCNGMTIKGQEDKAHNLIISGIDNKIYGGKLNDIIVLNSASGSSELHGGEGDDHFSTNYSSTDTKVYGEDGNDTITGTFRYVYGGNGDDHIEIAADGATIQGNDGNDYIKSTKSNSSINGGEGDDEFIISGTKCIVNGGNGNNTITDNGTNTTKINVPGANAMAEIFAAKETKIVTINGINYEITNDQNTEKTLIYNVENDKVIFQTSYFTIKGDIDKSHNVIIKAGNINFYGGNKNDTIEYGSSLSRIYAQGGDDNIILNGSYGYIFAGDGNDTITLTTANQNYISGDAGDDTYKVSNSSSKFNYTTIYDIEGNDTYKLNNNALDTTIIDVDETHKEFSGVNDTSNYSIYGIEGYQNTDGYVAGTNTSASYFTINNKTFSVLKNGSGTLYPNYASTYKYNSVTDSYIFSGYRTTIQIVDTDDYNIEQHGYTQKYIGSKGGVDKITSYANSSSIYSYEGNDEIYAYGPGMEILTGDGDDYIYIKNGNVTAGNGDDTVDWYNDSTTYKANLGDGNDIINIYAKGAVLDTGGNNVYNIYVSNAQVSGSDGNDTFYINGNNNKVTGGDGDDYFVINGDNNQIDGQGKTGKNLYVDNSTGGTNQISNAEQDPNTMQITCTTLGESKEINVAGKTYYIENLINGNNIIQFTRNPNTGIITIAGNDFKITSANNQANDLYIRGNNNIYEGSNLVDKIRVTYGSNNTIKGNGGNDILTNDSENNSILGGAGADTINVNKSTNLEINGEGGNDVLNINSNNSTQINTGLDNDIVNISGENNKITTQNGENKINISGNSNTIVAQDGNNTLAVLSANNIITIGNGNNKLGINGNSNTITAGNISNEIIIQGNDNNITQNNGDNKIKITGSGNQYTSTLGQKELSISGNGNSIITGIQDDSFEIKGDSNTIQSLGGNNEINVKGDSNQIQGGSGIDDIKINGNNNTAMGGDESDKFMVANGNTNTIDGEAGSRNTMINNGKSTTFTNVVDITPRPFDLNVKVGIGNSASSVISTQISFNLFDFGVDLSSAESALESLEELDELIANVDKQLLSIGSTINRLELVLDEQNIKIENMISTRSTLRDADIAKVSSEYIKMQILQDASATLLATSRNLRYENVIGLLQGLRR